MMPLFLRSLKVDARDAASPWQVTVNPAPFVRRPSQSDQEEAHRHRLECGDDNAPRSHVFLSLALRREWIDDSEVAVVFTNR
jgi:hypothetical protein